MVLKYRCIIVYSVAYEVYERMKPENDSPFSLQYIQYFPFRVLARPSACLQTTKPRDFFHPRGLYDLR